MPWCVEDGTNHLYFLRRIENLIGQMPKTIEQRVAYRERCGTNKRQEQRQERRLETQYRCERLIASYHYQFSRVQCEQHNVDALQRLAHATYQRSPLLASALQASLGGRLVKTSTSPFHSFRIFRRAYMLPSPLNAALGSIHLSISRHLMDRHNLCR